MNNKVIAVDIDDTLNNFSETLKNISLKHKDYDWLYKDKTEFNKMITKVKNNDFTDDEYKTLKIKQFITLVHQEVYLQAKARPDAIKFMQWLKSNNWKIIILTYRDLRKIFSETKEWFAKYHIPYDYFFSAGNKLVFCGIWKIRYLIDDNPVNIVSGPPLGINTYYPINDVNRALKTKDIKAIGFDKFDELYEVIK